MKRDLFLDNEHNFVVPCLDVDCPLDREQFKDFAIKVLQKNKHVNPQAAIEYTDKDGRLKQFIIGLIFNSDEEKEANKLLLKQSIERLGSERYMLMQEGWMSTDMSTRPSKAKDREECLIISEFIKGQPAKMDFLLFVRIKKGDEIVIVEDTTTGFKAKSTWDFFSDLS